MLLKNKMQSYPRRKANEGKESPKELSYPQEKGTRVQEGRKSNHTLVEKVDKGKESTKGLSYPRGKRGEGIGRQEK